MKKTLYLYDTANYLIKTDGPSLLVSKAKTAPLRVPFEYLDFIYINYGTRLSPDVIRDFIRFNKPAIITNFTSRNALHLIPVSNSGYFYDIPQRIAAKRDEIRDKVHRWMIQRKHTIQILSIKLIDENLSNAMKARNFTNDDYRYYVLKLCNNQDSKLFRIKKNFQDLFSGLIIAKCSELELSPELGIIHKNKKLGFVQDLMSIIDPVTDLLALKILSRNTTLFFNNDDLTKEGFKIIISNFERCKPVIDKMLTYLIKEVLKIIHER